MKPKPKPKWCIEFWDHGQWDEHCSGPFKYKSQAIKECEKLNKEVDHEARIAFFGGHRYRVRRCKNE